jgi:hypothetical protein
MVRAADTGRPELSPEAPGLLAASLGLSRMYDDDLEQLEAGEKPTTGRPTRESPDMSDIPAGRHVPVPGQAHGISFGEAFRVWLKIALLSFCGPAGQIAVMHRVLVEEKNWISESRFLHALNYCILLPGPEAQQLNLETSMLVSCRQLF